MALSLIYVAASLQNEIGYKSSVVASDPLNAILMLVYQWAGIVAVIVLIVASFFFVMSRGNPDQMKRARDAILGAVIGLIVVILAFVITRFIIGGAQS